MTHDEMIAVIQAHKDGVPVQIRGLAGEWEDKDSMGLFNFYEFEYRIKPEPKTIWVNEYDVGCFHGCFHGYASQEVAKTMAGDTIRTAVEYKEVLR